MEVVSKVRRPFAHNPTTSYTLKRDEFRQMEDVRLTSHFASWLSKVGERPVREESFEQDLMDGVVLCKAIAKLHGSGLAKFHDLSSGATTPLESFKARENIQSFVAASKALNLPITFGTEDLEKGNVGRIVSTLIFLAHCAHTQGVTVDMMGAEILQKVGQMDAALVHATLEEETKSDDPTSLEASAQAGLSWWQALLVKFGLGDWIGSLTVESLKAYLQTLKANTELKLEEQKQHVKQQSENLQSKILEIKTNAGLKIEEQKQLVRQHSDTFQSKLLEKTSSWKDSLPEVIRVRLTGA